MRIDSETLGCDYCGDHIKTDFIYYSFDFKIVQKTSPMWRESREVAFTADLCEKCMELFRQRLLGVAESALETPTRCDVSGANCADDKSYYKCHISKVTVNLTGQPFVCSKCGKQRTLQDGPCPCDPSVACILTRNAKVDVDDAYVDLNFSEIMFAKFSAHVQYIKGLGDAEWTK